MENKMSFFNKNYFKKLMFSNFLIILGCFVMAFGVVVFATKLTIVSGGLSGIGIIVQYFVGSEFTVMDIVVWVGTAAFWILGWFLCGKEFSLKTLVASIFFPLFTTLCLRVPAIDSFASEICKDNSVGNLLLCGIFTGVFIGSGVALTFLSGGSTGGFDTLIYIFHKYFHFKHSFVSFVLDGTVVLVAMFAIPNNVINSLVGIISAFVCALMMELIYDKSQAASQVDIISDKWKEISSFAQDELGRGATIIPVKGGYKEEDRIILRIVLSKFQTEKLKKKIAEIDPKAFVTLTQTQAVFGEGFQDHRIRKKKNKK